jgi:hypothetical protein
VRKHTASDFLTFIAINESKTAKLSWIIHFLEACQTIARRAHHYPGRHHHLTALTHPDLVIPQRHHRPCPVFLFLFLFPVPFLLAPIPYERSLL